LPQPFLRIPSDSRIDKPRNRPGRILTRLLRRLLSVLPTEHTARRPTAQRFARLPGASPDRLGSAAAISALDSFAPATLREFEDTQLPPAVCKRIAPAQRFASAGHKVTGA